jgi:hypothetical protein
MRGILKSRPEAALDKLVIAGSTGYLDRGGAGVVVRWVGGKVGSGE